jgi:hypothetical protein
MCVCAYLTRHAMCSVPSCSLFTGLDPSEFCPTAFFVRTSNVLPSLQIDDVPTEMVSVPHSFKVCSDKKSLYLFADSEEDRISWRRTIREAIRALRPMPRRNTLAADATDGFQLYAFGSGPGEG